MTEQERNTIKTNIEEIQARINRAAALAGRDQKEILLLAATKMNSAERVQAAIRSGSRYCGENKVQERLGNFDQD
ncbi:MAG: YggS family pyridoxal phosphate-dependent enzyme, partial [Lachnospiraceae bacterium]|nr:YggS family pyridoxal phosphate-dependent enzyme [Lachnospiraceae bacterium]